MSCRAAGLSGRKPPPRDGMCSRWGSHYLYRHYFLRRMVMRVQPTVHCVRKSSFAFVCGEALHFQPCPESAFNGFVNPGNPVTVAYSLDGHACFAFNCPDQFVPRLIAYGNDHSVCLEDLGGAAAN